ILQRDRANVEVVKALPAIGSNGILNLFFASAGLASPACAPHVLLSAVGRISPEEGTSNGTDADAFDRVSHADSPGTTQVLDWRERCYEVVLRLPDVLELAVSIERY